ncbi:peptidase [Cyanobium sp. Aljojuca 7D2]|uniref:peptidase n=1 Tax=Cyanobium sp. Aljojuca 7D2 TaxID=2823698 RepID=UPI0020CC145D|nr:peptidase [Cyanobium sp. Aljojuca 7D2]MCP9890602.1 peptidase [Cyanobium sp. Aljojuca 7D2]
MGGRRALPLLAGLLGGLAQAAWAAPALPDPCPPLQVKRAADLTESRPMPPAVPPPSPADYRHRLKPTPLGWPRLNHWCVWIEPGASEGPAALWDGRWRQAVDGALASWQQILPITVVADPARAQVQLLRRRPPVQNKRASHGRATLMLVEVQRGAPGQLAGPWQLEPQVTVQLSPGQGVQAMQATALHELGHAFGLWGHSDQPGDALAAIPGSQPVLELSPRDRATLRWLQAQPGLKGSSPGTALPPDSSR